MARRDYVNAVQAYNTEVRTFPGLLWAKFFWGAKTMETFAAAPESQKAPSVKF
ncbi:LemA family protein [Klebsiella pneumoniae]|uniref:LemA family protein n=1 Tax=Klebsiella pneumoniae TaxID=573 RepID=UPI0034D75D6B